MVTSSLPWQNTLPPPKRRRGGRTGTHFEGFRPDMIRKTTSSGARTSWSPLSLEERDRAQALANITNNYQRPDKELIEAMRKKQENLPKVAEPIMSSASRIRVSSPKQFKQKSEWEDKASEIIEREGLSLDREWSRLSWRQKASNIVRLKLLKDDGYDISPLMAKGVSADQIIDVLLARIEARKQRHSSSITSTHLGSDGESESDYDSESDYTPSLSPHDFDTDKTDLSFSSPHSVQILKSGIAGPLLSPEERFYATHPITAQKRKHTHSDDEQPEWHETRPQTHLHTLYNASRSPAQTEEAPCTCGTSPKILRLLSPAQISQATQSQAFDLLKWRLTRSFFHTSRTVHSTYFAHSTTAPNSVLCIPRSLLLTRPPAPKPSRVVFTEHASPGIKPTGSDAYMSSVALGLITREIQCLSWSFDASSATYCIADPDAGNDEPHLQGFAHEIRLSVGGVGPYAAVLEGGPRALAALMRYLRSSELFHLGKWVAGDVREDEEGVRDVRMRVVWNKVLPMHISPAAGRVLERIEKRLEESGAEGREEVRVGVIWKRERFRVA